MWTSWVFVFMNDSHLHSIDTYGSKVISDLLCLYSYMGNGYRTVSTRPALYTILSNTHHWHLNILPFSIKWIYIYTTCAINTHCLVTKLPSVKLCLLFAGGVFVLLCWLALSCSHRATKHCAIRKPWLYDMCSYILVNESFICFFVSFLLMGYL